MIIVVITSLKGNSTRVARLNFASNIIQTMNNWFNKNIKILFWNPRSIVNKKEKLQKILEEVDIFICVKSWLTQKTPNFFFSGLKTFRNNRQHTTVVGILALICNNLAVVEFTNLQCSENVIEISGFRITNTSPNINPLKHSGKYTYHLNSFTI